MSKRGLLIILGVLGSAIVFVSAYIAFLLLADSPSEPSDSDISPISLIEPPLQMPDFTLTNQQGENTSLSDLSGKPVLLTFGFTHCPDVCPITLGEMRSIHEELGEQVNYVFVSVDGERDTPEILANYFVTLRVDSFIVGLTGTEAEVREMGIPYGLDFNYSEADALGNYSVEHTAGLFLLNSEAQWIRRYAYGMRTEDIINDLREFMP